MFIGFPSKLRPFNAEHREGLLHVWQFPVRTFDELSRHILGLGKFCDEMHVLTSACRALTLARMVKPRDTFEITPEILLRAYSIGLFPMAESADDPTLFWVDPTERGVFPLDGLVVSRSLAKLVRSDRYAILIDRDFDAVIAACAAPAPDRPNTWINDRIRSLYAALFRQGHVHTVEAYAGEALVGGLYGVSLGGAFFGESMFHRARDASKVALVHLVGRLRAGGYRLLDTQFITPHLASLGAVSLKRGAYQRQLDAATRANGDFRVWPTAGVSGGQALAALADGTRGDVSGAPSPG